VTTPDFSPLAQRYARGRPRYPTELFTWIAGEASGHRLALDCATGNGQAALALADHFERVIATDVSREQLAHGIAHARVTYREAPAERSGLEAGSADAVTVAAAVHWFDLGRFAAEVERVMRPGGVLAVWTYHVAYVEPPFGPILRPFYDDLLAPYFGAGARLVDRGYRDLVLPGEPLAAPTFVAEASWTLADVERFVASWSGAHTYRQRHGEDPFERVRPQLEALYADPSAPMAFRLPISLRASRL
jgi:ubiquinone/menaquinone biosynthesis C-methylase UbiE